MSHATRNILFSAQVTPIGNRAEADTDFLGSHRAQKRLGQLSDKFKCATCIATSCLLSRKPQYRMGLPRSKHLRTRRLPLPARQVAGEVSLKCATSKRHIAIASPLVALLKAAREFKRAPAFVPRAHQRSALYAKKLEQLLST